MTTTQLKDRSEQAALAATERSHRRASLAASTARWALPGLLVIFVVVFSILRPDTYATSSNLSSTALAQSVLVILSAATLLPLIINEFDLSLAANLGFSMVLVAGAPTKLGLNAEGAIVLGIAAATLVGLLNGLIIAKANVSSFVVTLGMSSILAGLTLAWTGGASIFEEFPDTVRSLSQNDVLGVPLPVIYIFILALLVWYVLECTPVGRRMYALGGSSQAARLSGVRVQAITVGTFVVAGMLAGIGGVVYAGIIGAGNPTAGPPLLLPSFAACFLGATTIKLGSFNMFGTVVAIFTIAAGVTGLALMGAAPWVEPIFSGAALVVGVTVTRYLRRGVADGATV